ncbi:hypothetical protein Tco_0545683 [Tanacetum coccineum]
MITYLKNMGEAAKIKELMEIVPDEEEVAVDVIPLAAKPPTIIDWKIYKEGKKNYYQIIKADGSLKMYLVFSHMLKSFNRDDFKTLWKLVKAKYGSTRPVEDLDLILWGDLKTMFEPHIEDRVWRNQQDYRVMDWKLYDSCGVYSLRMQHMHIHMLVEKRYTLTPATITNMVIIMKIDMSVWNGIGVNAVNTAGLLTTAGRKLMLLGINLLLLLKFNAARHKLTTDVEITSPSGGKKDKSYESTIRRDLQLKDDEGVDCLPNATIFEQLTLMGYEKISQKLTFYKAFFSPQWKFLIHTNLQWLSSKTTAWKRFSKHYGQSAIICLATTRSFVQVFLDKKLEGMSNHNRIYVTPSHTKKIFGNMRRVGKGGGPRRQETMWDTIAQTRFENVSKTSNDPLLARGNTLQSCEDCLKLNELMELCTNLQQRVLDLETTKTTQANEIASLKKESQEAREEE